jgi:hypothetical protein
MEENKRDGSLRSYEKRVDHFYQRIVEGHQDMRAAYAAALLIKGLERLKASTEESSRQANRLSRVIKNLTWALVGLTAAAVILAALSLYALLGSAN